MPRPSDPSARARLLSGARRIFVERGLDRAKVEEITQAAGLSKGAFYLHFRTKEDAFKEILSGALAELGSILADAEATRAKVATAGGAEAVVEHWLETDLQIFEALWKHRALMRLVLEGGGSPDYHHLIELFADSAEQTSERLVRFGMKQGYYRADLEPHQAAVFVAGGYDRLARRLVRERKKPDLAAFLMSAQSLCLHALGTPALIRAAANIHASRLSHSRRASSG
jgi:AcrR family transcriptional regulator